MDGHGLESAVLGELASGCRVAYYPLMCRRVICVRGEEEDRRRAFLDEEGEALLVLLRMGDR